MKTLFFLVVSVSFFLIGCTNNSTNTSKTADSEKASPDAKDGFYFDYTIDGKEMHVDAEDILSTYTESVDTSLLIFAGKEDATKISLAIPYLISKPSTTPSGSTNSSSKINHGSIELSNYPEKNYKSSSHDGVYPEKTPIVPDAVVISSTEKDGEEATILTGTFNTKTYGYNKGTDPKSTDHIVKGKFRIKHKTSDSRLFNPTKAP